MKKILVVLFAFLFVMVSCSKDKKSKEPEYEIIPEALIRNWKYVEVYTSDGANGTWSNVPAANQYTIQFENGNIFSYSPNFDLAASMFNRFELKSDTLTLYSNLNANSERYKVIFLNSSELQVTSIDHVCIEGCASKLISTP